VQTQTITQSPTRPWGLWASALGAWLLTRCAQLIFAGWGTGNDVRLYLHYAQRWGSGAAPYADFHPEYPPGALPVFLLPYLVQGRADYARAFAAEMALFDVASLLLVVAAARRLAPDAPRAPWLAALGYLAVTAALFPVLYTRFDLVPGAVLLAALYASYAPSSAGLGALLLGIAGGVKLWPLALVPLFVGLAFQRERLRGSARSGLVLLAGLLLTALPFLPRAGLHVLDFLRFHAARGIQIESTWSTLALLLNKLGVADAHAVHNHGAFHVSGPVADWFARLSVPALLLMALLPQALWLRARSNTGIWWAAAASVLGFMVGGKVLSPQYMLWIAPLLPLLVLLGRSLRERIGIACASLLAAGLTSLVYPYWSPALEQRAPGHEAALLAVGTRNMLLTVLYVLACLRAARPATAPDAS
jgi:hypothetical protein